MKLRVFFYAEFNLDALLALAEKLRGQRCTCDTTKVPKVGGLNWVIFVLFDDGVEWVFRSPHIGSLAIITEETAYKMLASEASTLKYLSAHSSVPVPEVYSYSASKENDIGIAYILQSKAIGRPLSDYDWSEISRQPRGYRLPWPLLPLSDQDRQNIMARVGAIMSRLSKLHFEKIGSLFEDGEGNFYIGECLSPSLLWQWRDSVESKIDRGPFSEETQYFNSLVSMFTAHAKELPMHTHSFFAPLPESLDYTTWESYKIAVGRWRDFTDLGDKPEHSKNRFAYCIAGRFLREMIPKLTSTASGEFTLFHPDLHLGNIFVDDDLNMTCIIDWGSATTGPLIELLAIPGFAGSALPPSKSQENAFRSCFQIEPVNIRSEIWKKSEGMWYFSRLIRLLSTQDCDLFSKLYEIICDGEITLECSVNYHKLFQEQARTEDNKKLLLELQEDDPSEEEMNEIDKEAFEYSEEKKTDGLAVARKLTIISEMNSEFVADKRVWRWLEEALKQND